MTKGQVRNRKNNDGPAPPDPPVKNANRGSKQKSKIEQPVVVNGIKEKIQQTLCYLFELEDSSYLVPFRILWGLIMLQEVVSHISHDYAKTKMSFYGNPGFTFKYYGLDFGPVPDFFYFQVLLWFLALCACCVVLGLFYRLASIGFAAGFIYFFSLEATIYLNHFYLVCIMAVMLCFLPCNACGSLDSILFPSVKRDQIPK
jgi:vitamin K-dependent gamma-carboxylase